MLSHASLYLTVTGGGVGVGVGAGTRVAGMLLAGQTK